MERRKLVAFIIVVTVASVSVASVLLYTGFFDSDYNHGPIRITNDGEFTKENGVTGGSGTEEDPYTIEGWRIGPSDFEQLGPEGAAVLIEGVSYHFVVRDIQITGPNTYGIMLDDVCNGTIEDSTFILCRWGAVLSDCSGCTVTRNNFTSCNAGMEISCLDTTAIEDNRFCREAEGYPVEPPLLGWGLRIGIEFRDVTISGNIFDGMSLEVSSLALPDDGSSSGLEITPDNLVNGDPVRFFEDQDNVTLHGSPAGQVIMFDCRDVVMSQLEICQTGTAISLFRVDGCTITDCLLSNASAGMGSIFMKDSEDVTIQSNYMSNGQVYLIKCSCIIFEDNIVSSSDHGLSLSECDNVTIQGNIVQGCVHGMGLHGENFTVTGNILQNNEYCLAVDGRDILIFLNDFMITRMLA